MTEKLYYIDSHLREFTATVISCTEEKGRWLAALDRTAFFPEGGGQGGDIGTLGDANVTDTHERSGVILHYCDRPLPVGETVSGRIDWTVRFARMQIHSAEHLVTGNAHRLWGCENVGFHMTEHSAVLDFDRELTAAQLTELQTLANEAVWANLPVNILYPTAEELQHIEFRQKKELSGQIRLVEVPGIDRCACCAPHVSRTGEIGLILLTDMTRHRGGVRITMTAGRSALAEAAGLGASADALSQLFSAPRGALPQAAERILTEMEKLKAANAEMERRYVTLLAGATPPVEGDLYLFIPGDFSSPAMRILAEALRDKCGGVAAVFAGDDNANWRYVLSAQSIDLRPWAKEFNTALLGRGGGSAGMVQGSVVASQREITAYFHGNEQ